MKTRKIISLLLAVMMIVAVIPAGIISISAAEEAVTFDSGSWDTSTGGAYSVKVGDGTYLAVPINNASFDGYNGTKVDMPWRFSATSTNKADLSKGFTLTFDAKLISKHGAAQAWGVYELYENFFRVDIGDTITFRFANCSDTFYLKVGSTEVNKVMTSHGGDDVYKNTAANAAELNGSYIIKYDGSKVTVTINNVEILSAPVSDSVALAEDLAKASIGFSTLLNHDKNSTSVDLDDVFGKGVDGNAKGWAKVVQNIALTRTVDGEGGHICRYDWTNAVSNNDATCTQNGTEYAECTCGETRTREDDDSALGHSYVANEEGTTKTCSVCGKTIVINVILDENSWIIENEQPNKSAWSTADGKNFTTTVYYHSYYGNSTMPITQPSTATSAVEYDLSGGFKFTYTANIANNGDNGNRVANGDNRYVAFGDAIKFNVHMANGKYILTAGGKDYTLDISEDRFNKANTTFSIVYKNGKVSVYSEALGGIVTFSDGTTEVAVDAAALEGAKVVLYKGWGLHTAEAGTTPETVDVYTNISFETIPAPVAPVYEGVQEGMVDDVFSVRFVGTVKDLNYSEVGFEITAMDGAKYWTKSTNTVYSKLIGNTGTGIVEYTKENLSGEYIYALTIKGVPKTGTVTFNVKTYGIVDGVKVVGKTYAVTYTNGVYDNTVAA